MRSPRIHVRNFVLAVCGLVALAATLFVAHKLQVRRQARLMREEIDARVVEGDTERAIEVLTRYIAIRPADNERLALLARLAGDRALGPGAAARDATFAREILTASVARMPRDAALRERLARVLLALGDSEGALRHLDNLRERSAAGGLDQDLETRVGLLFARTALAAGRGTDAEETLERLVEPGPDGVVPAGRRDAFLLLFAIASEGRRLPAAAEQILLRMTRAYPDDLDAAVILGEWYVRAGRAEEAAEVAARLRAVAPDDPRSSLLEASVAIALGEIDRAEEILAGPLASAPPSLGLVLLRADVARARGDADGLISVLREGATALPDEPRLLGDLAVVLADRGRIDELRESLPRTRERLGPEAAAVRYAEATVAMADRRWVAAARSWESVRERLGADGPLARRVDLALAECYAALGQADKATEVERRVAAADPRSPMARILEAEALAESGRTTEALGIVERLAASMSGDELVAKPAIWQPLLRLRLVEQARRPDAERDWSQVDQLAGLLDAAPGLDDGLRDWVKVDILRAKGRGEEAVAAAERVFAERPEEPAAAALLCATLAAAGREKEALERQIALPPALRDAPIVLAGALALVPTLPPERADAWLAEVARGASALDEKSALGIRRRLMVAEAARGRPAEAERLATEIAAAAPEDLPVRQMLLEFAFSRADAEAVAAVGDSIVALAGAESAVGRVARAFRSIAEATGETAGLPVDPLVDTPALDEAETLLAAAAAERPDWPDVDRGRAAAARARGDLTSSIGHLRRAVVKGDDLGWARRRLAVALVEAGRIDEAMPVIEGLSNAGGAEIERIRAELTLDRGDVDGGLRLVGRAVPPDCRDASLLAWSAAVLARTGRMAEAEAACRRAIQAAPRRGGPRLELVRLLADGGRADVAAREAEEATAALSGTARARFEEAAARILRQEEALVRRRAEAAASAPEDATAGLRFGECLLAFGRQSDARREFERVSALPGGDPAAVRVARRRSAVLLAAESGYPQLQQALAVLASNVADDGRQSTADAVLSARLLGDRGDPAAWRRAVALLDEAESRRPLSVDERVLRARLQIRLGGRQRDAARAVLAEIADSPDGSVAGLALLVEAALESGDTDAAGVWLDRLRQAAPAAPGTAGLEIRLAIARGDRATAEEIAARLVGSQSVTPANESLLLARASLAESAGVPDAAERVFVESAARSAEGKLRLARALGRWKRPAEAIELLESIRGEVAPLTLLSVLTPVVASAPADALAECQSRVNSIVAAIRRENPGSPEVALQAAIIADVSGRHDEASEAYRSLVDDPDLNPTLRGVAAGNLAFDLAVPATAEAAEALVEKALAALGPIPDLLDTRALVRLARGETSRALEDAVDAVLEPSATRFLHLALVQVAAGDLAAARRSFDEALERGLDGERLSAEDSQRRVTVEAALDGNAAG